jgi:Rubredoxin
VERLRAAEKFMTKGTGEGECKACGYNYFPKEGDDEYPVPKGTRFEVCDAYTLISPSR